MNYKETTDWLFNQLPMYQKIGKTAFKKDLSNSILLDKHLNHPHKAYPTIHLAGTNGKGSTAHMIASCLQEAGYKVGLYTSPHLKDFRERIKVNGEMISQHAVIDFVKKHRKFLVSGSFSFFEMTVAMAFNAFKNQAVDIAVIETGLGGRLDSTNIITPILSVITTIDKDHEALLGNTLTKIASEKAGIIKDNIPVVIGEQRPHLRKLFKNHAAGKYSPIEFVDHTEKTPPTDLNGSYQFFNTRVAYKSLQVLNESDNSIRVNKDAIEIGLLNVKRNTGLRGRFESINRNPRTIAETAHNLAGIKSLIKSIKSETYDDLHIIFGCVADKDVAAIIKLLPSKATYYLCEPDVVRAMPLKQLTQAFEKSGLNYIANDSVETALHKARSSAAQDDLVIVTGSIFVVAQVL